MKPDMLQDLKYQAHAPHLWLILFTVLALAAVVLIPLLTVHQAAAEAPSLLTPVLSPPGGTYDRDVQLKIHALSSNGSGEVTAAPPEATVIFTVDGSVPTLANGNTYTHTIRLSVSTPAVTVVRARAVLPGPRLGPVVNASYFVGVPFSSKDHSNMKGSEATHSNMKGSEATHSDGTPFSPKGHSDGTLATLPMMSLIVDPDDLWDPELGIYTNPLQKGDGWERPVDVTYVDKDRRSGFHVPAGVRIHGGAWNRGLDKKSLRLYFRQEYGTSRLEYPLFEDSEVSSFKRLVLHAGGQDWQAFPHTNWTLMRNQLAERLMLELEGYVVCSQPVLLFINGESWGIYHVRERLDRWFFPDHYGIKSADFLEGPEFAAGQDILMGDRDNWDHLLQFVETQDMADPASYAYVQTQVDIANFIDYNILQIYMANTDWPFQNEYQFRPRVQGGRWHWLLWDSDYGFGSDHYSDVNWDMIDRVLNYNHPQTGGRDLLLLRKLLENPSFFEQFVSRAADLLNTTLAPESVTAHIDALAAELEPNIHYEAIRWSSSVNWETSVQELRDFARQRPDFVRQHIFEHFDLNGTAQLTFNPPTSGSGTVAINRSIQQELPWQGVFFQNTSIQVTAVPAPGFRFAGWESPDLPHSPIITLTPRSALTLAPRFELLPDNMPHPGDVVFASYLEDRPYSMNEDSHTQPDRFELRVTRPGGVDLHGWRITDNDTKSATDEGSLIFADCPALAHVPSGTTIEIIVPRTATNLPEDDLTTWDRHIILYAGNAHLDSETDPGFNLGPVDNLVLLAPGPTRAFGDDQGIAFVAYGDEVTPASFGVLSDGVLQMGF